MRSRLFALVVLVAGVSALVLGAAAVAGPDGSDEATACVFTTQLRAENEAPTPSTSTAFGHTQVKVLNDGTIEWKTHIVNPDNESFFAGHIHKAPAGSAAPPIQGFTFTPTSDTQIFNSGSVSNPTVGAEICADPAAFYVNYHTTTNAPGAVRGQLG